MVCLKNNIYILISILGIVNLELKSILQYQILQLISVGAHGKLYRAFDSYTGQVVALKVLYPNLTYNSDYVDQLNNESKIISSLDHVNIVKIFEVGNSEEDYYISLQYLPENLERILKNSIEIPIKRIIEIGSQIASGLSKAHSAGVIHKDIKPQNILIGSDGELKLVDFGIAFFGEKLSIGNSTSTVISTPYYISPEHINGELITTSSDIYSLGCILYQISSGKLPFDLESPFAIFRQHIENTPVKLHKIRKDIPKDLVDLIESCMEKKPYNRLKSVDEFLKNLNSIEIANNNKSISDKMNAQGILDESKAGVKSAIKAVNPQGILDESKAGVKSAIKAVNPQAILDESKASVKSAMQAVPTTWMDDVTKTWEKTHRNRWAKIGTITSLAFAITGLIIRFGFWDEIQSFAEEELNVELPALAVSTELNSNNLNAIQNIDSTLTSFFEISEKDSSSVNIYEGIELHFPIGSIDRSTIFEFYKSGTAGYERHIKQFDLNQTPQLPDNYQNYKGEMVFSIFEYKKPMNTLQYSTSVSVVIRLLRGFSEEIPSVFMWNSSLEKWELLEFTLLNNEVLIAKINNTGLLGIFVNK